MKHALPVLVLSLALFSCERDHGDPLVTPPDAPGDESPDTGPGPGPGAGNPLEPDQRIECELDEGYQAQLQAGRELTKTTNNIAIWPSKDAPSGTPWVCYDEPGPYDCRVAESCDYVGPVTIAKCSQTAWSLAEDGRYYAGCGYIQESDLDGDGRFEAMVDGRAAYVAVVIQP